MRNLVAALALSAVAACGADEITPTPNDANRDDAPAGAVQVPLEFADTFKVYDRDNYRIVDLKAPFVSWGGTAQGSDQKARIVLVAKDAKPPALEGDLAGATLIRTPVERIATNYGFLEALTEAVGAEDRLVAVGGVKSYNDEIRALARAGKLAQVGYGWHSPPEIDPLLDSDPDVFLMVLGDLGHAEHYERIKRLGVPVVPIFFEAETSYMGPVDYVRLMGMLTGEESAADGFVSMVAENVDELKLLVADAPRKKVLSTWYSGGGRWMVTVRNADNQLLEDAGGINPLSEPDNVRIDDFVPIGTEVLLERATDIDCWIIRDSHAQPFDDVSILENFEAWREGCLFANDGMSKPEADSFDIYHTGLIRPDLVLGDMVSMLHPELRDEPFLYIRPDTETPRP